MKRVMQLLVILVLFSCGKEAKSPVDTAQIVVESFYKKENDKLKEYTTPVSYESFITIQDLVTPEEAGESNFKLVEQNENGEVAWVKFTTAYEEKPETFKLIKNNGRWKVTEIGIGEKVPF